MDIYAFKDKFDVVLKKYVDEKIQMSIKYNMKKHKNIVKPFFTEKIELS